MKRSHYVLCVILTCCLLAYMYSRRQAKQETEAVSTTETIPSTATKEPQDAAANEEATAMVHNTHLRFKGVPIDGTLKQFVNRMKESGFTVRRSNEGEALLTGDFAGFKDCRLYVQTLQNKDLVSQIRVCFPERDQWKFLYDDYKQLKDLLTEKYGKPTSCVEKFQDGFITKDNDNMKMLFVGMNMCKYESLFTVKNGKIILSIQNDEDNDSFVMLSYIDKENNDVIREHALDDL